MKKKKILIFGMTSIVGGIETFLMNLYENIDLSNIQVDFLVSGKLEGAYRERIEKRNGKIYEVEKIKKHPVKAYKQLKKIYKINQYDIIYMNLCNAFYFIYILPMLFLKKERPHIISHSHSNSDVKILRNYIMRPILRHYTDQYFACSQEAGEWVFSKKIVKNNKLIIIKNPIDSKKYKFEKDIRDKYRKELGIEQNFVIGHVGRFYKEKNHEFLIDIFKEYKKIDENSKLVLVGDGVLKETIEDKVKELELDSDVIFLGIRNDINKIMQAFDIFVLPSKFEGFGIVGLEAQASGLYTIVSENVVDELDITNHIEHIDLQSGASRWAKEIKEKGNIKIDREKCYKEIEQSDYDLNKLVNFVEKSHLDKNEEE